MLEKVIENWTSRMDYIRASRGSPMPEIMLKIPSNTILTDIANCAVSTASVDSSGCKEKNSQVSTSFANFASKLLAINSILLVAVLADNCNMLIAPNISVLFLKSSKRESAAILA
ncbi:hypothetical protein TNCV_3754221 [Trichonephila clavipes]|nr:hypothetical protein TNCV_3754221 [Trichonephila clavipes]